MRTTRSTPRILPRAVGVGAAVAIVGLASPAAADPGCTPSYSGYGPTVTIDIDYSDPARSSVDYDSSDFSVVVDPCI